MDYYRLKVLNNKKKIIVTIFFILIVIGLVYYFVFYHDEVLDDIVTSEDDTVEVTSVDDIYVDIKGHISKPGVYSFKSNDNARIIDLINKAGGLTKDADTSTINLSKKVEDEMTVIIYSKSEISNYTKTVDDLKSKLEICEAKIKNNACIKVNNAKESSGKVNINEASQEELTTIPGIGEAKANAIIEYRKNNKFNSIEDIKNVEGIGENLFANIKESITV